MLLGVKGKALIEKIKAIIEKDKHLAELLKGAYIAFCMKLIGLVLGYILILLISKAYGAEAVGVYSLAFVVLRISAMVSRMGMDTYLLRHVSANYTDSNNACYIPGVYHKVFGIVLFGSIMISVTMYLLSTPIAEYVFHKPQLGDSFKIIAVAIVPFTLAALHQEAIRGAKKILWYAYLNNVSISLFGSLLLLILIYIGSNNCLTPIVAVSGSGFVAALMAIVVWRRILKATVFEWTDRSLAFSAPAAKDIFKVAIPLMLISCTFFIMNWIDTLVLGVFETTANIGVYTVALKVAMLTSVSLVAVNSIAAPKVSKLWSEGDMEALRKVVHQSTSLTFLAALPLLIAFLVFPSWVLGLFGKVFDSGVEVLMILAIGQFVNAVCGPVGIVLSMTGHQVIAQNIIILAAIVNLLLSMTLVQPYGIFGVAWATMISTVLWNFLMNYYVFKKLGFITIRLRLAK
ncbi:flippase [Geothermobacter hydrogeniphilus]|uniref:Uncharacterized protein n=1 Tax=Geothermobacter hydrogeniphilus TaxID=1969733 RepID=A0A1X0Y0Z6_9BACT|nr:flippase [Geothermobacter hydrogeniphilus]ORJ58777.1 hypothetical protein B5V00_11825 [Geothermobacter hydrogeniphilus]